MEGGYIFSLETSILIDSILIRCDFSINITTHGQSNGVLSSTKCDKTVREFFGFPPHYFLIFQYFLMPFFFCGVLF